MQSHVYWAVTLNNNNECTKTVIILSGSSFQNLIWKFNCGGGACVTKSNVFLWVLNQCQYIWRWLALVRVENLWIASGATLFISISTHISEHTKWKSNSHIASIESLHNLKTNAINLPLSLSPPLAVVPQPLKFT